MPNTKYKIQFIISLSPLFFSVLFLFGWGNASSFAQNVGINSTGAAPNASALLDIDAAPGNNKGLLIPRVSFAERTGANFNPLPAIAKGLLVYQTDAGGLGEGFYYNISTTTTPNWIKLFSSTTGWALLGNAGTSGGTNFLGTTDAQDLVFKTNNTEWMRILSGGNIGIGTASPGSKLVIDNGALADASLVLQNSISDGSNIRFKNSATNAFSIDQVGAPDGRLRIFTESGPSGNVERLTLLEAGNIGIGTTSPGYKLDIQDAASLETQVKSTGANTYSRLRLSNPERDFILTNNAADDLLSFNYNGANRLQFNLTDQWFNSGFVGIGTISPGSKLDVAGQIRIRNGNSLAFERDLAQSDFSTFVDAYAYPSQGYAAGGANNFWVRLSSKGGTHVLLNTDGGVGAPENTYDHFVIWQGIVDGDKLFDVSNVGNSYIKGNLGIGTTSLGAKLEVSGQIKITGGSPGLNKILTSDATGLASWTTYAGPVNGSGTLNYVPKWTPDGTTLGNSSIFDNGNVGIGTTTPAYKLDVSGNAASNAEYPTLTLDHPTSGGTSGIAFRSRVNLGSDIGFLLMQDESANNPGSATEDVRLTLGVYNDFRQSSAHSDELWLQGGGRLVQNIGTWDSELNTIIGTPGAGTTGGYEWRVNNAIQMILTHGGYVGIGTTNPIGMHHTFGGPAMTAGYNRNTVFHSNHPTVQFKGISDSNHSAFIGYDAQTTSEALRFWVRADSDDPLTGTSIEAVTIKASGNVGIGTSNPRGKLDIAPATGEGSIFGMDQLVGLNDLRFYTDNAGATPRMYIDGIGNVGIGTTSPNAKLDVSTGSDGIAMGQIHGDNTNTIQTYIDGQWTNRATYAGGCCNPLLLQPDVGVVGIRTTAPSATFDVNGSTRIRSLGTGYVKSDASGNLTSGAIASGDLPSHTHTWSQVTSKPAAWLDGSNLITDLPNFNNSVPSGFYQSSGAANAPGGSWYNLINVRHSNTGNDHGFQIAASYYDENIWTRTYQGGTGANNGTYTPWRYLIHSGNVGSQGFIPNNGSGDWQIASNSNATGYSQASLELRETNFAGGGQQPPRLGFHWGGVVASQIGIEASGRIAILNNPGNGYEQLIASNMYANDYYLNCWGWLSSWFCSDERYKKNIVPLKNVLPDIMKLQGVKYNWRAAEFPDMHFDEGREIGIIAQELEKIFPEIVNTNKEGYKSVDYGKLSPILIEAVKELNAKNEIQKKINEEQQKMIEEMKKEIDILKKK